MAVKEIKRAAVLGAGVMGATIAAHLANVGLSVYLLDIVPRELAPDEEKKGLSLQSPQVRNRLAIMGKDGLLKQKLNPLYRKSNVELITPGNFDDAMAKPKECDWIIEVIVENMEIKKKVIAEGQKEGLYRHDLNIRTARKVIFGAIDEVVTCWAMSKKAYDLGSLAGPVYDLLVRGLQ